MGYHESEQSSGKDFPGWNFKEQYQPGFKPVQVDTDNRFIAFTLPDDPDITLDRYKGEYGDYFFDSEGNPISGRIHSAFDTRITIVGDQREIISIHEWAGPPERANTEISFPTSGVGKYIGAPVDQLGHLRFESVGLQARENCWISRLDSSTLGNIFYDRGDRRLKGPVFSLFRRYIDRRSTLQTSGLATEDWELFGMDSRMNGILRVNSDFVHYQLADNIIMFQDETSGDIYKLEWEVKDGVLTMSQTHVPSKIRKILTAPIFPETTLVSEAIFSEAPYDSEKIHGRELLKVPWTNVGRLISAHLSYEFPEEQKPQR